MKFTLKKLFSILLVLLCSITCFSQSKFDIESLLTTKPTSLVVDYAGILTQEQLQTLQQKLVLLDDSTSTQIAVVIVPNIGNYDIADFNVKLLRAWGVGGKKNNSGVVLLISTETKKLNIATGYGVEGALPDVTSKRIIDNIIVPAFKGNDYYRGINEGTNAIMQAVRGEYNDVREKPTKGSSPFVYIIVVIIIMLLLFGKNNGGGGTFMSRRGQTGIGEALLWSTLFGGGGSGGGWSGGGGNDSGGGGFGGFGGGSGGGGGASGSW